MTEAARTLKARSRELAAQAARDLRGETVVGGVKPKAGMWIVHPGRGRVYGRITAVLRTGHVEWLGRLGKRTKTEGRKLVDGGYRYVQHAYCEGVS